MSKHLTLKLKQFSFVLVMLIIYSPVLDGQTENAKTKYPVVELGYNSMSSKDWIGLRFREIIPASNIKKVIMIRESGFAYHNNSLLEYKKLVQADYDALLKYLIDSEERAQNLGWLAEEGILAELIILTNDDQVYHLEILGILNRISSVTINSSGKGVRIEIKEFQRSEPIK